MVLGLGLRVQGSNDSNNSNNGSTSHDSTYHNSHYSPSSRVLRVEQGRRRLGRWPRMSNVFPACDGNFFECKMAITLLADEDIKRRCHGCSYHNPQGCPHFLSTCSEGQGKGR